MTPTPPRRDEDWWQDQLLRLTRFAATKIPAAARRDFDADDVAASALRSYLRRPDADRAGDGEGEEVWGLLRTIAERKISKKLRARRTAKRGEGQVRGESVFEGRNDAGLAEAGADHRRPDIGLEEKEQEEALLALLRQASLREVARLRMQGLEQAEIAEQLDCGLRTVERRLSLVRRCWEEAFARDTSSEED